MHELCTTGGMQVRLERRCVHSIPMVEASVWTATYSPDGKRIVTASVDNTARVWDVAPESRTADEIERVTRCRLLVRFASDDSDIIVPAMPNSDECLPAPLHFPNH